MAPSTLRTSLVLVVFVSIVVIWTMVGIESPPGAQQRVDGPPAHIDVARESFDEPDAAARYQRMKRRGPSPGFDTVAAYHRAHARLAAMPRYSTRLGVQLTGAPRRHDDPRAKSVAGRALGEWEPLGPGNIGGRTRTLVIHPSQPDIMYAGGVSGGVWKTTDGGQSWTPLADQIANIAVNSMAMHPENPDVLFVGTGEGYFREIVRGTWLPLRGGGIFKTEDGGATWSQVPSTDNSDFHWVNDLIISPKNADVMYAATRTGVQLSEDGGESWTHFLDPQANGGCLDLALRTDKAQDWLFASCGTLGQATVWRRKMNRTGEWEAVLSEAGMGRTSLAIAPSSQNIIYALSSSNYGRTEGGGSDQHLHAVYRSRSGGAAGTWTVQVAYSDPVELNTLLLTNAVSANYIDCGWGDYDSWTPMGWYCNVISVDPVDPEVVWAGGVDLFRSDDGGRNWGLASYWWATYDAADPSWVHADQHTIVFHPDYDGVTVRTMYSGSDGGIFRTDNPNAAIGRSEAAICDPRTSAVSFENLNHGFGITQFYHGAPFPGGEAYLGGTQDNGTLLGQDIRGSDGWLHINGGDGGYVAIDPDNPNNLYVESQWFGFRRSTDGGYNFVRAVNGVTEDRQDFLFITPFAMDPNNGARLWTGGRRLWRTDNGALNWNAASTTLGTGQVSALAVAWGNSDLVVVGDTNGFIYRNDEALAAGATTVWQSSRPRVGFVSSLAFDPSTPGRLYATFAGFGGPHVWRSDDGAVTWEAIDGTGTASIPDVPVHSIVVDPDNPRRLYVGTDLGVMTSTNGGLSWAAENTGFANAVTEWLALETDDHGDPWLFAFTHGRGAYRVPLNASSPSPRRPDARRGR
jgi:photosystem II stability/assembly factor-like uncharacterized protein